MTKRQVETTVAKLAAPAAQGEIIRQAWAKWADEVQKWAAALNAKIAELERK